MSLSTEDRIEQLSLGISAVRIRLSKINPCHTASGPSGGQFCETGGGGGGAGASATVEAKPTVYSTKPSTPAKFDLDVATSALKSNATPYELTTIKNYSGYAASNLNPALRGGKSLNASHAKMTEALDSAIQKSELPHDVTVYRGLSSAASKMAFFATPGSVFSDKAYASTTVDKAVGKRIGEGGVLLEIKLRKGTKALPIDGLSRYPEERELLLPRNTSYKIKSKTWDAGNKAWKLTVEVV